MHTYTITHIAGDRYQLVLNGINGDIEFGDPILGLQKAIDTANGDCWERCDELPENIHIVNPKDVASKTRPIDRAVFKATKLVEAGEAQAQAISIAAVEFDVREEDIAEYFKLVLLPHERAAL